MPPAPEVRDPGSTVWMVKVLTQLETKEPAKAYCHIGIAGKIKIQLQRIGKRTNPQSDEREIIARCDPVKVVVRQRGKLIGN